MRLFIQKNSEYIKEKCFKIFRYLPNQVQNECENKIEKYLDYGMSNIDNFESFLSLWSKPTRFRTTTIVRISQFKFDQDVEKLKVDQSFFEYDCN